MTTVRQLERLWNANLNLALARELLAGRPEASLLQSGRLDNPVLVAALVLIRLDELAQSHVPLYGRLLRLVLAAQEPDGGWADPLTSAVCLRALLAGRGAGAAVDAAFGYFANLQKPEGIWPGGPLRRLPADPFVSALILLQVGSDPRFQAAVRFDDAIKWFRSNEQSADAPTRRLWDQARLRCQSYRRSPAQPQLSWS
jgi:hypothetical protein